MKQPKPALLIFSILVLATALLFQNCSDQKTQEEVDAASQSLPFAYDATIDTIAYMSCAGAISQNPDAIWTFHAGSYGDTTGIRLTDAYLSATSSFTREQRVGGLADSVANASAHLQLAARPLNNYQALLTNSGWPQVNQDYASVLGPLDNFDIAEAMVTAPGQPPSRINYIANMPGVSGRNLEGHIRFTESESLAHSVRENLRNSAVLTLTYSASEGDESGARSPNSADVSRAYGHGYRLGFGNANGDPEARLLTSVQELDLNTGQPVSVPGGWNCYPQLEFRVARNCNECTCAGDPAMTNELSYIRRVLKVEFWYIDLTHRCIVQKDAVSPGQCYPSNAASSYNFVSICARN